MEVICANKSCKMNKDMICCSSSDILLEVVNGVTVCTSYDKKEKQKECEKNTRI